MADVFQSPEPTNRRRDVSDKPPSTPIMRLPPTPFLKKIGYGTGVDVFLMERSPRSPCQYKSPWALKKVNSKYQCSRSAASRLRLEAEILKELKHPNIIGFRAFGKNISGDACLAMEHGHVSLGDLVEKRNEEDGGPFLAGYILKVAYDVALALSYLHDEKRLLHGDIKSANILIAGEFEAAKLCDFGVSLQLNEKGIVSDPTEIYIGTRCWSAKEAVSENGVVTHKTDIFSYGLVLWEMMSLNPPHVNNDDMSWESATEESITERLEVEEQEFEKRIGTRPALPDHSFDDSYKPVIELFYCCTSEVPDERPSAKDICQHLAALIQA